MKNNTTEEKEVEVIRRKQRMFSVYIVMTIVH